MSIGHLVDYYESKFGSKFLKTSVLRAVQDGDMLEGFGVDALRSIPAHLKNSNIGRDEDWSSGPDHDRKRPPLPNIPEIHELVIRAIQRLPKSDSIDLATEDGFHLSARGTAAAYVAMTEDEAIYQAFDAVCANFDGYNKDDNRQKFERYCHDVRDGKQDISSYWLFRMVGLDDALNAVLDEFQVTDAADNEGRYEPDKADTDTTLDPTELDILQLPPADQLAVRPRPTLWGPYLQRRSITMLGGAGGTGKSVFKLVLAVSVAIGRDLLRLTDELKLKPPPPRKVLVINNEDDGDELLRRLVGIKVHYKLTDAEYKLVTQNLYYRSGTSNPVKLACKYPQDRFTLHTTKRVGDLKAFCLKHGIDVVFADPLVSLHDAQENDNGEMDHVMQIAKKLAADSNIALLLVHHTRKDATGNVDDAFRGASAVVNAARGVILLTRMSKQESEKLNIGCDERTRYFRMDFGKHNYGLPSADASWFRNESVTLEASPYPDDPDAAYQHRTVSVGVPEPVVLAPVESDDGPITTAQQFVAALHTLSWPVKVSAQYEMLKDICRVTAPESVRRQLKAVIRTINEDDKTEAVAVIHGGKAYQVWCEKRSKTDGITLHRQEVTG